MRSFRIKASIEILCEKSDFLVKNESVSDFNSTTRTLDLTFSSNHRNGSEEPIWINYTIQYPFEGSLVSVPLSCNQTDILMKKTVHPNEFKSAYFLTGVAAASSFGSFLMTYFYLNNDRFSHKQTLFDMLFSGLMTFLWVASTVSWCSSVSHLKHFGNFFMYYTSICNDSLAVCSRAMDGTWCRLYLTVILGFINCFIWFCWTCWKFYAQISILFYYFPREPRFSRITEPDRMQSRGEFDTNSISTIEDKIEYEREGFFQALRDSENVSRPPTLDRMEETTVVIINPQEVNRGVPRDIMIIRFQAESPDILVSPE